jgi:exonuclease III
MAVTIITYNLHGFNQGKHLLPELCNASNIIMMQELWLFADESDLLNSVNSNFVSFYTSAMSASSRRGVRRGRPYGGVGFLVNKNLLPVFRIVSKRERFMVATLGDMLLINVYFPCLCDGYRDSIQCMLSDLHNIIMDTHCNKVVIGGDFNFDFSTAGIGRQLFCQSLGHLQLSVCDDFVYNSSHGCPFTYFQLGSGNSSFIDHFCVSQSLLSSVQNSYTIDSAVNLSDHLPLCLVLQLDLCAPMLPVDVESSTRRIRWDKGDINAYYACTYDRLKQIIINSDLLKCNMGCNCDVQYDIDILYHDIVSALDVSATLFMPKTKCNLYKSWWNDTLSDLKTLSITAHKMWQSVGRPSSGMIFLEMRRAKIAYKNAIRAQQVQDNTYFSNELHDMLIQKDMVGFWKSWNSKIVKGSMSTVIDGSTDGQEIANKFASHFQSCWSTRDRHSTDSDSDAEIIAYISRAQNNDFTLLDVETVDRCLRDMKKGRAPGVDGIQTEHLLFAHPLVIVLFCCLFNIMLLHGAVPNLFSTGVIVPIVKDKQGDITDVTNYRGITLSPCISKLFEKCLVSKFGHLFAVSPLQFGFQKKLSCSHAIYVLRAVTEYYVDGLSTVNVATLDLTKAFDMVNHSVLFQKLIKLCIPSIVLQLLINWYTCSSVCVRWGAFTSSCFQLLCGVRQGGVLSPILFCVYVDSVIQRLQDSKLGCWLGEVFVGCIMYADDIVLLSASVCELQMMIDVCVQELSNINMKINVKKCSILRFGRRYSYPCASITIQKNAVMYTDKVKYLGVLLHANKMFSVDIQFMKSKFYGAFNSVFHRAGKFHNEAICMQLVNSFCKPHLVYSTECLGLNITKMRSLRNTWQCAVSHIFNLRGVCVNFVCSMFDSVPLDVCIINRRVKFLQNLQRYFCDHSVLSVAFAIIGRAELFAARDLLLHL